MWASARERRPKTGEQLAALGCVKLGVVTRREFTRLTRHYIEPRLPRFVFDHGFFYLPPTDYLLRSVFLGSSAYSRESFYVFYSVAPLYVPQSLWALGIGERTAWEWPRGDESGEARVMNEIADMVARDALPLFDRVPSPTAVVTYLQERNEWQRNSPDPAWRANWRMDPRVHEDIAYSLVLAGEYAAAISSLENLVPLTHQLAHTRLDAHGNRVKREPEPDRWATQAHERATHLLHALGDSPESAVSLLHGWAAAQRAEAGLS